MSKALRVWDRCPNAESNAVGLRDLGIFAPGIYRPSENSESPWRLERLRNAENRATLQRELKDGPKCDIPLRARHLRTWTFATFKLSRPANCTGATAQNITTVRKCRKPLAFATFAQRRQSNNVNFAGGTKSPVEIRHSTLGAPLTNVGLPDLEL